MRLMIVDDDARLLDLLQRQLMRSGHEVRSAANGRIAFSQLQLLPADVVITDWNMPEMDGVELCRAIRAHPQLSATYIIMLTAEASDDHQRQGLGAGADDYLTKPCRMERLLASVRTAEQMRNDVAQAPSGVRGP